MRKVSLGMAGAALLIVAIPAGWVLSRRGGVAKPTFVVVSGQATVDDARVKANQTVAPGGHLQTGPMSVACFAVHTTRICLGTETSMRLAALDGASETLDVQQGTLVVGAAGDHVQVTLPGGSLQISQGLVEVEVSARDTVIRAYDGSVSMTAGSQPASVVSAPATMGLDGRKRFPNPQVEREERAMIELTRAWDGSSGAIVEFSGSQGRAMVDGHGLGRPPASVLLATGPHTIVVSDGTQELVHKNMDLSSGQKIVIDDVSAAPPR